LLTWTVVRAGIGRAAAAGSAAEEILISFKNVRCEFEADVSLTGALSFAEFANASSHGNARTAAIARQSSLSRVRIVPGCAQACAHK
jgi:hypothetical protein